MAELDATSAAHTGRVARQFERAARLNRSADFVYREVERRMIERLDYIKIAPARILDLGAGLADQTQGLLQRYPDAELIRLDAAPALLASAAALPSSAKTKTRLTRWLGGAATKPAAASRAGKAVAGDALALPLADAVIDLVWSNCMLHDLADPARALAEVRRVLKPDGLVMLSLFGVDTLQELRAHGGTTQVFPDLHDIGDALQHAGFAQPVVDVEKLVFTYSDPERWLADLRAAAVTAAAHRPVAAKPRGLRGRRLRGRWIEALKGHRLDLTFEVVYAHGWTPSAAAVAPPGYAPIKLIKPSRR